MVREIAPFIREHWNVPALITDLRGESWDITEHHATWVRIDRRTGIGTARQLTFAAKQTVTPEEWEEAKNAGVEHEIADEYLEALSDVVGSDMGEHVYGEFDEDQAYLGQYEEGPLEELQERFTIREDPTVLLPRLRKKSRISRKFWDPE